MPLLVNHHLKGRHTRRTPNVTGSRPHHSTGAPHPAHRNFLVTILGITGTGYVERFYRRRAPNCTFAEYYVVDNGDDTHNLYAYIQLRYPVASIGADFPVKAKIQHVTVAEKFESSFQDVPDKISFGVERNVQRPQQFVEHTPFREVHTAVKINVKPGAHGVSWLVPNPEPKIDFKALLARLEPATNKGPVLP